MSKHSGVRVAARDRRAAQVLHQTALAAVLAPERKCPPSRAADSIVHCDQVKPGDLMLVKDILASVEHMEFDASRPAYVGLVVRHPELNPSGGPVTVWRLRHRMAAVRRYVEG